MAEPMNVFEAVGVVNVSLGLRDRGPVSTALVAILLAKGIITKEDVYAMNDLALEIEKGAR